MPLDIPPLPAYKVPVFPDSQGVEGSRAFAFDYPSGKVLQTEAVSTTEQAPKPFTLLPLPASKVKIYPGQVNGVMPKIGAVALDDATPPELTVTTGPVYLKITYVGALISTVEVLSGTIPAETRLIKYRQVGTVVVASGVVTVTAQLLADNVILSATYAPFFLEGFIESEAAKIYVRVGQVNSAVPTIGGTSLADATAPALTVTGASGQVWMQATIDGAGTTTALTIANLTSAPTDDPTHKHKLLGSWTVSGGVFTSVTPILNTNQTLYLCGGTAIWEA